MSNVEIMKYKISTCLKEVEHEWIMYPQMPGASQMNCSAQQYPCIT